jgi:hypothetical protein
VDSAGKAGISSIPRLSFSALIGRGVAVILLRIDAPIVNLNFHFLDRRAGVDLGLTSSYSRAG